jgi:hypothetical protein
VTNFENEVKNSAIPQTENKEPPPLVLEEFKTKYETRIVQIAQKKKEEEEKKKLELEKERQEAEQKKDLSKESPKHNTSGVKGKDDRSEDKRDDFLKVNPQDDKSISMIQDKSMEKVGKDEKGMDPEKKEQNIGQVEEKKVEEKKVEEKKVEEILLIMPEPEKLKINPNCFIESMGENYNFVIKEKNNVIAGELMILKLKKEESDLFYEEYASTNARLRHQKVIFKTPKGNVTVENPDTIIQSYFVDLYKPLRERDWEIWMNAVINLEGIGYMVIPPLNIKWPHKMDANIMHVLPLPNEGLNVISDAVPLDHILVGVSNYENSKGGEEKKEFLFVRISIQFSLFS